MTHQEQSVIAAVDALSDYLVNLTSRLVRVPTVNPYSGDSSAGCERAGQELMIQELRSAGAAVQRVNVPADVYSRYGILGPADRCWQDRFSVVGRFALGRGGKRLILNCHMDTVGVEDYEGDPFSGHVEDGKLFGRGSSDSKGNLAAGLAAIMALKASGVDIDGELIFESVVDEECNGAGAGTLACLAAGVVGDGCLALDGGAGSPYVGCYGVITPQITVRGRSGHAANGAVNAIDKLMIVKAAMDDLRCRRLALSERYQVNVGVIRGGSHPAIVPQRAWMQYNLVYSPEEAQGNGRPGGMLIRQVEQAIADACAKDEWLREHPPQIVWMKDAPPYRVDQSQQIIQIALGSYADVFGHPAQPTMLAWGDAAHFWNIGGIPVAGMGSGSGSTAHSSLEYIELAQQLAGAKAIALAAYRFLTRS